MATVYLYVCGVPPNAQSNSYSGACPTRAFIQIDSAILNQLASGSLTQTLTIDRTYNAQSYADMVEMTGLFFLALVTIWGAKQLLNLFAKDID